MNKLDLAVWYGEHSGQVLLVFGTPVALLWYFYFEPIDRQELTWIVIGAVAATYYFSANRLKKYCYETISKNTTAFARKPNIKNPTSEDLIDRIDVDLMTKIDEMREEKGDYFKIIGSVDIVEPNELLERLGKLKYLGYIHASPRRLTLTSLGLESLDNLNLPKVTIPPRFSVLLARAKINLDEGNFNGVLDTVNILLEDLLKVGIEIALGNKLEETWTRFKKEGKVVRDFERVSLGQLLSVSYDLRIVKRNSIIDNTIASFLKLRTPQKHSVDLESDPHQDAKSALDMVNIILRDWFHR